MTRISSFSTWRWYRGLPLLSQLATIIPGTKGFQVFPSDAVAIYPAACASALSTNVTGCSNVVLGMDPSAAYDQSTLQATCNTTCTEAMSSWFSSVSSSCSNVTYLDDDGFTTSIADIPGEMFFNYNQTCLVDDGSFCNLVLSNLTASVGNGTTSPGADCNECALLLLRNTAESPYGDGPLVLSEGIYQSYTSSCGYTGYPLTSTPTTTATLTGTSASASASATCTGTTYTIQPGDTCNSISLSQGIATNWILLDNDLAAYCYNFPISGTLCLSSLCTIYTVQENDTCTSVASAHNITKTQLLSYNPWVDVGCYNFNRTVGSQICVTEPGKQYVPPSSTIGAPSVASTAVPVPTNVATNTTTTCGQYYDVQPGDYCDIVVREFGLTLDDFRILNPEVNENCTNLFAYESYCVMPVGSYDSYPDSPFYTGTVSSSITPTLYSTLPNATYIPFFPVSSQQLALNTSTTCYVYASGDTLQFNISGVSDCAAAADVWGIELSDLQTWNPSLETNNANCTFVASYRYCMGEGQPSYVASPTPYPTISWVSGSDTSVPTSTTTSGGSSTTSTSAPSSTSASTTTTSSIPSPTQANSISRNCNAYAEAQPGDYCSAFASAHGITTDQLYAWNSVLGTNGANCASDFWADEWYCVGVAIPSPVQANSVPLNCDVYAQAQSGDYCYEFATANGITTAQLYAWNTVLGSNGENCGNDFWADEWYCVGVNG